MSLTTPVSAVSVGSAFAGCLRGGVALWTALVVPALAALSLGAVEFTAAARDRSGLQQAADAAALAGALELGVAPDAAVARSAEALALEQAKAGDALALTAKAEVIEAGKALEVVLTGRRESLLGGLGPGVWRTRARAVANVMNRTPRCVIGLSRTDAAVLSLRDQAHVLAAGCAVHSNRDVTVAGGGKLKAEIVQAAGAASGPIEPEAQTGTEPLDDPFAGRDIRIPGCPLLTGVVQLLDLRSGTRTLPAGIHCGDVYIRQTATLNLAAGDHYFLGDLIVADTARLNGTDVALFFGRGAQITFRGRATVDLVGRKRGKHAGLLIVTGRDNTSDFRISSDNVRRLEGVIYMPLSRLLISGAGKVASQSEWTVTVTKALQVSGSPTLVINQDYAGSSVPVPSDLGPGVGGARLAQ